MVSSSPHGSCLTSAWHSNEYSWDFSFSYLWCFSSQKGEIPESEKCKHAIDDSKHDHIPISQIQSHRANPCEWNCRVPRVLQLIGVWFNFCCGVDAYKVLVAFHSIARWSLCFVSFWVPLLTCVRGSAGQALDEIPLSPWTRHIPLRFWGHTLHLTV